VKAIDIGFGVLIFYIIYAVTSIALNFSYKKIKKILHKRLRRDGCDSGCVFDTGRKFLRIDIPKNNEAGPICAEQIFATLHSISPESMVSFGIANYGAGKDDGKIIFFVNVPVSLKSFVESQIYAQYPDSEISESDADFDFPGDDLARVGLRLDFTDIFPLKRYPQFEDRINRVYVDPIASIVSSLSKSRKSHIRIDLRPLPDKWRKKYLKCLHIYASNALMNFDTVAEAFINIFCTRKLIYKFLFFPLYFVFWVIGNLAALKSRDSRDAIEEKTSRIHERESKADAAVDKISKPLFKVSINIFCEPVFTNQIVSSFYQFNLPYLNNFEISRKNCEFVLNTEELATIWHLPIGMSETNGVSAVGYKKLAPPNELKTLAGAIVLGKTDYRDTEEEVIILPSDRRRHVYILGKTGMGKSTLIENMIFSDISSGNGVGLIDPHGDLSDRILEFIPSHRINDVILFDPSDKDFPIGFNIFECKSLSHSIVASGIIGVFKKIYGESWGPRLEYILRNTILTLIEVDNSTLLWIIKILQNDEFRRAIVAAIKDPVLKNFWIYEFEKLSPSKRTEVVAPILNKVGQFLSNPIIRNILCQPKTKIDFRFMMDTGKIVIVNLSKGKIGEDNCALLGAMLITKFYIDAMSRADTPEKTRRDFYLYIDEFQNFATDSFADILSEARKYRLCLTIANQYIAQMYEKTRDAIFGNTGTIISFQVGYDDAEFIALQLGSVLIAEDPVFLSKYKAYIKLLMDGMPSKPFSIKTLPPVDSHMQNSREKIIKISREKFAKQKDFVEEKICEFSLR